MPNTNTTPLPLPSINEEKEAFHKLANIEDYPDFIPKAYELALAYLSNANFEADPLYNSFDYTPANFSTRMDEIYHAALPGMYDLHSYDKDIITWSNGKKYRVGRASDKVVKDRILQLAPFNLMDGVWLQFILQARPSDNVQSRLFNIWSDEVGNGESEHNHSNVYDHLLRSQGFNLPPVTSKEFLDIDVAPGAWRTPVFQMCMGLFPQKFFPELIGMTLFLEWEATPTLMPIVNMLEGRGMNPLFYALHVAIDNISEGHGALAKEAIQIFLDEKMEEGGNIAVQQNWKRIWRGYVTWATAGFSGEGLAIRRLLIDRKSINIGTTETPECIPDYKEYYKNRMIEMLQKKAPFASEVHGAITVGGVRLNELFSDSEILIEKLIDAKYFDINSPRNSRFFELLEFDGPMYKVFTNEEKNVILDWLESLNGSGITCTNPVDDSTNPEDTARAVKELLIDVAARAERSHDELVLPGEDGSLIPIKDMFSTPSKLMAALIRGGWVIPYIPERSMLITRLFENSGPMDGEMTEDQVNLLKKWISEGAILPDQIKENSTIVILPNEPDTTNVDKIKPMTFLDRRPFIGQGCVH